MVSESAESSHRVSSSLEAMEAMRVAFKDQIAGFSLLEAESLAGVVADAGEAEIAVGPPFLDLGQKATDELFDSLVHGRRSSSARGPAVFRRPTKSEPAPKRKYR
jgi:hypothetical protein